ncbi:hypothetical protein [Modicisalibacter coralii]|uniref:hypothetical protein n=1 Tax=Modicisalibacter coralii TaxID=2304602 RepID=UPI00100A3820|nr:hypothetical protein [Halomonas coralii]
MHNLTIPALTILLAAALIFGGQALTESHLDERIAQAIATRLDTRSEVEVTDMREVNNGYGICGHYRRDSGDKTPFFFNKVNEHLALDGDSNRYRVNCLAP